MRMTTEGDGSEVHEQMPMQRLILVRDLQLEDRKKHPKENGSFSAQKLHVSFNSQGPNYPLQLGKKKTQANPVILSISIVSLSLFSTYPLSFIFMLYPPS